MPASAVSSRGIVVRGGPGSSREMSGGTSVLETMAIFRFRSSSVMMANWETSAELPAVVGMQMSGGAGTGTRSTPSNVRISRMLELAIPIPLAQSIGLPPRRR